MALEHQRQMIVTPATSRLHSLLVWRFVRWTDRTHLGGRLWAWHVPQIAAIVVAVSAIGLAIAERRARARQATEWAAISAARGARLAAEIAARADAHASRSGSREQVPRGRGADRRTAPPWRMREIELRRSS
jgi:hypothetical protein